jgi:xanthine dehydrogenase/oxidase
MGIGFWLFEKARYDPISGRCLTNGTWEYKPPTARDIPVDFRITFMKNNPNPLGVLGSKCVGEPPLCLSSCVAFAIKNSIENARAEINNQDFFPFNSPSTVESIQQMCLVDVDQFDF